MWDDRVLVFAKALWTARQGIAIWAVNQNMIDPGRLGEWM